MEKIKVFLAEDHAVVREGLRELINREMDMVVVGEAGAGDEAVRRVKEIKPDVVLMDISMPGLNGIEATRQIKENLPRICILVLTAYDNPEFIFAVIEAGAAGYLLKNAKGKELVNAIRAISMGESVLHPTVAQTVFARLQPEKKPHEEKLGLLSERELEVIRLGAEGLGNKEIAATLSVGTRTVQTHWRNIFNKLGVYSRTEAIILGLKKGWLSLEREGKEQ
jgi:DNA-binding NarL/FixJ family response regulator